MENEHSELIIGYLQGRLQGRSLDDFYAWVNESADNKKNCFSRPKHFMKPALLPVVLLKYTIAGFAFSIRESPASVKDIPY